MNLITNNKCVYHTNKMTFGAGNNNVIYGDAYHIGGVNRKYNFL